MSQFSIDICGAGDLLLAELKRTVDELTSGNERGVYVELVRLKRKHPEVTLEEYRGKLRATELKATRVSEIMVILEDEGVSQRFENEPKFGIRQALSAARASRKRRRQAPADKVTESVCPPLSALDESPDTIVADLNSLIAVILATQPGARSGAEIDIPCGLFLVRYQHRQEMVIRPPQLLEGLRN